MRCQNERLRHELQEKHTAFDLVLKKLDELEREQRREKERHDSEVNRVKNETEGAFHAKLQIMDRNSGEKLEVSNKS